MNGDLGVYRQREWKGGVAGTGRTFFWMAAKRKISGSREQPTHFFFLSFFLGCCCFFVVVCTKKKEGGWQMTSLPTDGLFAFDPDAAWIYVDFPSPFASTFFLFYFLGFNRRRRRIRASCHFVSSLLHPLLVDWPLFPPILFIWLCFSVDTLSLSRPALDVEHVNTLLRRRPSQINDRESLLIDAISMAIPKASKLKELGRHLNSRQFLSFFFVPHLNQCKIAWNPITYPPPFSFWKDFTFPEFIHRGWGGGNWDDLNHFAFRRCVHGHRLIRAAAPGPCTYPFFPSRLFWFSFSVHFIQQRRVMGGLVWRFSVGGSAVTVRLTSPGKSLHI